MKQSSVELFLGWIGAKCSAVVRDEYSWRFEFDGAGGVAVTCLWRIIHSERIALCASDDGQKFGLPQPIDAEAAAKGLLLGKTIEKVAVEEITADMRIEFQDGTVLELLNNSAGYEAWQAICNDGARRIEIIGMGGGEIAIFEQ